MDYGVDVPVVNAARKLASKMFAGIGVTIEWTPWRHDCPVGDVIVITLSYDTPNDQFPGDWAYARPYEGTHIVVFYDRVRRKMPPAKVPILLAHVLVHEITHILQGVKRHSASGIMKPEWDPTDLFQMVRKPLGFAKEDVVLIHDGIDGRKAWLAAKPLNDAR
jgi:hypothetical protein